MNKTQDNKTVVVTGDVTIDWNIARVFQEDIVAKTWTADEITSACCQRGGAFLLAELIETIASNLHKTGQGSFTVHHVEYPRGWISPVDTNFHHSYSIWAPHKLDERKPELGSVWRVREFLGVNSLHKESSMKEKIEKVTDERALPDIIVLNDDNQGFRDNPELWPQVLSNNEAKPWIVLKMAKPVMQGRLWEYLISHHSEQLIVVMTADDLRSSQVQISRRLSWERTAQDMVWELLYNPKVNSLAQCGHVIVSFGTAGAILVVNNPKSVPQAVLFFDPKAMEGEWGQNHKGYMVGYNTCLTAGITHELMLNTTKPNVFRGIQSGIHATRVLHIEGYGHVNSNESQIDLTFPISKIASALAENDKSIASTFIKMPLQGLTTSIESVGDNQDNRFWAILEDKYPNLLEGVAEKIVVEGLEQAIPDIPMGSFGNLKTVDRKEIEGLRSISGFIHEYHQRYQKTPLSIAVFGPPGSGKSFTVKEIAKSVLPGEIETLTFNLSQLAGPNDLYDAFHQVRDKVLIGKIPLVFWDEFDTKLQNQPLGWLRYFLAPMQDGEFQEGQIVHPIGRSIFIFAGGTSYNMESFGANLDDKEQILVKLPDFVSRLKGFLNILGPNRQVDKNIQGQTKDPYYIIRRAILLRSILERSAPRLFINEGNKKIANIDQGLLLAFLLTNEYKHGARSMEAIVSMSQLAGKSSFERSCLPYETQLNMHVDSRDFSSIMNRMELTSTLVEKLAETVHELFVQDMRKKGWTYGLVTHEDRKEHSSLKPYQELPDNEKEQNRSNARDIQRKLTKVGYVIVPMRGNETPGNFSNNEVEILAVAEHERWMQQKFNDGWQYAEKTDKEKKLHQDLVLWEKLTEEAKEKDRILVRGIPTILTRAGYMMVKL